LGNLEWAEFLVMIAGKMEEQAEPRSPTAMLRLALESVRADISAIYGSSDRPKDCPLPRSRSSQSSQAA
jgi:hypothetical protein